MQTLPKGIFQQDNARPQTTNCQHWYIEQANVALACTITGLIADRTSLGYDGPV
jgi:phage I-like protein